MSQPTSQSGFYLYFSLSILVMLVGLGMVIYTKNLPQLIGVVLTVIPVIAALFHEVKRARV